MFASGWTERIRTTSPNESTEITLGAFLFSPWKVITLYLRALYHTPSAHVKQGAKNIDERVLVMYNRIKQGVNLLSSGVSRPVNYKLYKESRYFDGGGSLRCLMIITLNVIFIIGIIIFIHCPPFRECRPPRPVCDYIITYVTENVKYCKYRIRDSFTP